MSDLEVYNGIFKSLFEDEIDESNLDELEYGIAGWDSVMSMDLLEMMEQEFEISISAVDKMAFNSYQSGIEMLNKYGIKP